MTTEKESNSSLRTFLGILVIGIIILFGVYSEKDLEDRRKKEDHEYVNIEKTSKEFKGKIISKQMSKGYKGSILVQLNNNRKFSMTWGGGNYLYSKQNLSYFMQVGDSIFKPLLSDSIYVFRGDKKYHFILGQTINQ